LVPKLDGLGTARWPIGEERDWKLREVKFVTAVGELKRV
jgi:hypothetical protein